jgi:hypothetical protein
MMMPTASCGVDLLILAKNVLAMTTLLNEPLSVSQRRTPGKVQDTYAVVGLKTRPAAEEEGGRSSCFRPSPADFAWIL